MRGLFARQSLAFNLTFSGGSASLCEGGFIADESLEGRRRVLGAVIEFMLTVQHHL